MTQTPQPPQPLPQPPPQPQPAPPGLQPPAAERGNPFAVVGLILSIASFVLGPLGILAVIAGLVLSILGVGRARATGKGMGLAVAGIVVAALMILLALLAVVIWFWSDISRWAGHSWQGVKSAPPPSSPAHNLLPLRWWVSGL